MPSFDIVSEVNQVEVRNAVDQANKEIGTRFDFKGSDARAEYDGKVLTLFADDDFKLKQVTDIVTGKLAKRQVDVRSLKFGDVEKISGNKVKQAVTVRVGIEQDLAKRIEVAFPLRDPVLKKRVIDEGLLIYVADNQDAWELNGDGEWDKLKPRSRARRRSAQSELLARMAEVESVQ